MLGATLSRWTMAYFATAPCCLLAAEGLLAAGYGFPSAAAAAPETLIVVHLVTIGWLTLIMLGALFQFIPVLIARPIHSNGLPLPTLILLLAGLAGLILGFVQLAGSIGLPLLLLPVGALLFAASFGLAFWNLGRTMWSARPLGLPARFVAIGLASGAATVFLGSAFSLILSGESVNPQLLDLTANGLPVHIAAGLGGWLTFTAFGVSYRLGLMRSERGTDHSRPSQESCETLNCNSWTQDECQPGRAVLVHPQRDRTHSSRDFIRACAFHRRYLQRRRSI